MHTRATMIDQLYRAPEHSGAVLAAQRLSGQRDTTMSAQCRQRSPPRAGELRPTW